MMKNYKEAAKCFDQAIKFNPENLQIYRDAGNLYLHSKQYHAHKDIRRRFVTKRPDIYSNWCSFSFACYLSRDYEQALEILDSLIEMIKKDENFDKVSLMGVYQYRARLLRILERDEEVVKFVIENKAAFLNKIQYCEILMESLKILGRKEEMKKYNAYLLKQLPDNLDYINEYIELSGKDSLEALEELKKESSSTILEALILEKLGDDKLDEFRTRLEKLFVRKIKRCSPSFIRDLTKFTNSEQKTNIIDEMFKTNIKSLSDNNTLINEEEKMNPTVYVSALYQYSYFLYYRKDYQKALETIEEAIEHTPTMSDYYVLKAKILKKTGKIKEAAELAVFYQTLNTIDRNLAKPAVELLLKNGEIIKADKLFKTFISYPHNVENMVHDNQKVTYELKVADAYHNRLNFQRGLRMYKLVLENFEEFNDDQYDFYTYSLRRFRMDLVLDMISFNDHIIKNTKIYAKAFGKYLKAVQSYSLYKEEGTVFEDGEVIEIDEKAQKSFDVTGERYMAGLDLEKEMKYCAEKSSLIDFRKVKSGDAVRLSSALFNYYTENVKVVPLLKAYNLLLEKDVNNPDNILRKKVFDDLTKKTDKSSLNDIEKSVFNNFVDGLENKHSTYLKAFKQKSCYMKEEVLKGVVDIYEKTEVKENWQKNLRDELRTYYKEKVVDGFGELKYKAKSRLIKLCKERLVDKNLYFKLKGIDNN